MNYDLLVKIRESKGLTQQQMANYLGYRSKGTYCLIENGKTKVTIELAKNIKRILKLTSKEFNLIFFDENVQEIRTNKVI